MSSITFSTEITAPDVSADVSAELDIFLSPGEFVQAMVAHEREAARLALALRRLENSGELATVDKALTTRAWLRDRCRMTDEQAGRWVARARFLDRFCTIAERAVAGDLSAGQVEVLRAFCPPRLRALMDDHQHEVVPTLGALSAADTITVMDLWRKRAEAIVDADEPQAEPQRSLTMNEAADGALLGRFELHGSAAAEWASAIKTARTFEGADDRRTKAERDSDAMGDIAAFYNRQNQIPTSKRRHPHVELGVEARDLTGDAAFGFNLETGRLFDHATTDAVLCDCVIHTIMRGSDNLPIGYGRARYTVPRRLFRLVAQRDGGCRFPGCERPVSYCDAHHLHHWRKGGFTDYDNLGLLCNRHHHLVHRDKVVVKLLPDAEMHFTWPDGTHRETAPRGRARPGRPPDPPV